MAREDDGERRVNTIKEERRDVGGGGGVVLCEVSRELCSAESEGGGVHQWIEGEGESEPTCCPHMIIRRPLFRVRSLCSLYFFAQSSQGFSPDYALPLSNILSFLFLSLI